MRDKVFSAGFSATPPTLEKNKVKFEPSSPAPFKLNTDPIDSNLGKSSSTLKEDETWDGMKKFNDIPVNPEITVEKPKMSNEEMLKQKLVFFA